MATGARHLPGLEQAAREMPFDQYGRYHMLREAVDACRQSLGKESLTILDVGGFYESRGQPTLPLRRFLVDDEVTVLDVVECDLPGYVQGDGTALHFEDASFDLVVSADTLEHIPGGARASFWQELLRVARHGVILLAPFHSPEAEAAEALLFEFIKVELRAEHQQLKEHRDYGLPRLDEWLAFLASSGVTAKAYPTGYLHSWLGMMLITHLLLRDAEGEAMHRLVDEYYNRTCFMTERRKPAYRHLIAAEKTAGMVAAVDDALLPTLMPDDDDVSAQLGNGLLPTLFTVVQYQLGTLHRQQREHVDHYRHQVSVRDTQIADQRQHIANLEQIRAEQHGHIMNLQQGMEAQHGRITTLQQSMEVRDEHITTLQQRINDYQRQMSFLERAMADQQLLLNQMQAQVIRANEQSREQAGQYAATVHDLTQRAQWLEGQAAALRHQLEAVQRGRVLRLLNRLTRT
jgi:hypothetical protein